MSKHATVPVGEYTVPLIGIPPSATQEKCSRCGSVCHLSEIVLDEKGQPCCQTCLKDETHEHS
jgi:hypothetical protein